MNAISHSLSALAAGALLLSAAGAVQAQTPYTAYSQGRDLPASCRNVQQLENGYVSAECQADGGWRWSALRPADCRSSISNRDGVLTCTGARASVGALYPDNSGYGGQAAGPTQSAPGGIIGALFGAVFGDAFGNDRQIDDDYSQGRRPLGERRAALEARIDAGVRDGSISRSEATRLRGEYNALVQLETRYAADGRITTAERDDLRNRYQALSQRVGDARDDGYGGGYDSWRPLVESRVSFNQRLEAGVRNRALTRAQATRLTTDFNALVRLETDYNRNGLDARERQDLEARWADLNRRVGDNWRPDGGYDGGYGQDGRAVALEARITANERSGRLSRTEAARLREELRDLSRRWMDLEARVDVRR
jgi:hypothetical protein